MFIECCNFSFCPVSINGSTILKNDSYNILVSNEPNKNMEEHKKMEQEVITMVCTAENQPNTVKKCL